MTDPSLRIVFAGTPGFAADHLQGLITSNREIVGIFTQPDRPAGRGKKIQPSPVKMLAESHNIPVYQPLTLDNAACSELSDLAPDVMVVVAYGLILPPGILQIPRYGCINVHASLLPRWRGAAPIERAILAGDNETGVSLMQMDAGLDTGDVLLQLATPITTADNAQTITARLTALGITGLNRVLTGLPDIRSQATPQNTALATYAPKLRKEEARIDWHQPATTIHHQVQAFYPRSPAWCPFLGDRLRLIETTPDTTTTAGDPGTIIDLDADSMTVACGEGALKILSIQLPGKKPLAMKAVFNGHAALFTPGTSLATAEAS